MLDDHHLHNHLYEPLVTSENSTLLLKKGKMSTTATTSAIVMPPPSNNLFIRYHGFYFFSNFFVIVGLGIISLCINKFYNFERQFFEQDPNYSYYSLKHGDTVPGNLLFGLSIGVSAGCILIFTVIHHLMNSSQWKHSQTRISFFAILLEHLWLNYIALITALAVSSLFTDIIKNLFSHPRPDFFYLCNYQGYRDGIDSGNLTQYYALTNPTTLGKEDNCWDQTAMIGAMKSFPSGHASLSFAGMSFTSFFLLQLCYLNHKYSSKISSANGGSTTTCLSSYINFIIVRFLCFTPYIISVWIAVTRIRDYKHGEIDVTVGGGIGIVCSYIAMKQLNYYLYRAYNPCLLLSDRYPHVNECLMIKKTDEEQLNDVQNINQDDDSSS